MLRKELIFFVLPSILWLSLALIAQADLPGLHAVDIVPDPSNSCGDPSKSSRLSLTFDSDIEPQNVMDALMATSIYEILQLTQPNIPAYRNENGSPVLDPRYLSPIVISATSVTPDCCQKNIIYVCTSQTMQTTYDDHGGHPILFRFAVNINGDPKSKYDRSATFWLNRNPKNPGQPQPLPPPPSASYDRKESKGKDDSDVYISGDVTAGRRQKPDYTTDVKIRIPFNPNKPSTRFLFDLKSDTNPKADADSLDIGVEYSSYIGLSQTGSSGQVNECRAEGVNRICAENLDRAAQNGKFVTHFDWSLAGKIESDRRFKNTNLIGSGAFKVPIYIQNYSTHVWTFDPFIGIDLGRNVRGPVAIAGSRGIVRPFAGISTFVGILRTGRYFPVSFEADYTHRWPLVREFKLDKDDNGNLQAIFLSKRPKYFIDAKLNFQFSPFVGFYIGFQRGELPPLYELVNPTLKVGLTYKFKFKGAVD